MLRSCRCTITVRLIELHVKPLTYVLDLGFVEQGLARRLHVMNEPLDELLLARVLHQLLQDDLS